MNKPDKPNPNKPDPNLITWSPATVMLILVIVILLPLLLTGFISQ